MYNWPMHGRNIRRILALLIVLISCILLAWGFWPLGEIIETLTISPADMQLPTPEGWLPGLWVVV